MTNGLPECKQIAPNIIDEWNVDDVIKNASVNFLYMQQIDRYSFKTNTAKGWSAGSRGPYGPNLKI